MEPTKGIKTSEFWLMAAAQVLTLLFASGVVASGSSLEKVLALVASVLGALGYAVVRGGIKKQTVAAVALASKPADPTEP